MEKLHLGIDIQTLSTFEKNRGIGRYSLQLIKSLSKKTNSNIKISLFGFSQSPPDEIKSLLSKYVDYRIFNLPQTPQKYLDYGVIAPLLWDDIAADIDCFLVTSPLMHDILIPEAAPCKLSAILYDLIPYFFQGNTKKIDVGSLRQTVYPPHLWDRYVNRLNILKNYDHFFSISESTKSAFSDEMDIPQDKISTLYCGLADCYNTQRNVSVLEKLKKNLSLPDNYLLSVTGFNFRKNIEGGIRIYSNLPQELQNKIHYVIHCSMNEDEKNTVNKWIVKYGVDGKVILSCNEIADEDLAELYRNAEIFFFPSLYEGLGLPVLEAMACGVPVISSDTSGLNEIVRDSGVLVNPYNEELFTKELANLINNEEKKKEFREKSLERIKDYSWDNAADVIIKKFSDITKKGESSSLVINKNLYKESTNKSHRIAFFSPLSPLHSGISDYSESLLAELRHFFDIDLFVEDYIPSAKEILIHHEIFSYRDFNTIAKKRKYCLHIFHIGNNSLHNIIYRMIKTHPGIVVMHEFSLFGFIQEGLDKYFNKADLWDLLLSEPERQIENPPADFTAYLNTIQPMHYPLIKDVVRYAKSIIVHSSWLKNKISEWIKEAESKNQISPINKIGWGEISVIPMGADLPPKWVEAEEPSKLRKKFHIADDAFVIAMVGTITRFKRVEIVLNAFSIFKKSFPNAVLAISGTFADMGYYIEIQKIIEQDKYGLSVRMFGYLEIEDLIKLILASDVCVNLRYPTLGEMSGIIPRIMGLKKPLIVSDIDSFSELPDTACFKVAVGDGEAIEIAALFRQLAENPETLKIMGQAAEEYVKDCSWKKTAERYKDFIIKTIEKK